MAHVQTNFTAGSFSGGAKKAAATTAAEKPVAVKKPDTQEHSNSHEAPEGTSEEVLAWVGHNPGRARKALAAEKKDGSPRPSVTSPLEALLERDRQAKAAKKAAAEK